MSDFCDQLDETNALELNTGYSEIIDLRSVSEFRVSPTEWRSVSKIPLVVGARRIIVAPSDLLYGMARMFQAFAEPKGSVEVVRSMEEAARLVVGLNQPLE